MKESESVKESVRMCERESEREWEKLRHTQPDRQSVNWERHREKQNNRYTKAQFTQCTFLMRKLCRPTGPLNSQMTRRAKQMARPRDTTDCCELIPSSMTLSCLLLYLWLSLFVTLCLFLCLAFSILCIWRSILHLLYSLVITSLYHSLFLSLSIFL